MENPKQSNKICYKCKKFNRYYTRGLYRFTITKHGFCNIQQKIVESHYCCDNWVSGYRKLFINKKMSMKVLSELLFEIAAIKQVLLEVKDERDNEQNIEM